MPLDKTIFAVRCAGAERILFSALEKKDGELILVTKTAERATPGGPIIREQRFSVHPSLRSQEYTTIKQTLNTADGKSETSVVLTDAVKRKNGFSVLYARRVQNLSDSRYIISSADRRGKVYVLADYDPELYSMYFGVFLAHPDVQFDARADGIVVSQFPFKTFQLVVLTSLAGAPSHYSTHYATAVTFPPEISDHGPTKETLRYHMSGRSPKVCLHQYLNSVKTLIRLYWEAVIPELDHPELIQFAREQIAAVSDVELTEVKLGTATISTHMLKGGKPPNLR